MNDWDPRKTADGGHEWTVNDAGGSREIELEYEYCCGPTSQSMAIGYVWLSRDDLVAMLAAIDKETDDGVA